MLRRLLRRHRHAQRYTYTIRVALGSDVVAEIDADKLASLSYLPVMYTGIAVATLTGWGEYPDNVSVFVERNI